MKQILFATGNQSKAKRFQKDLLKKNIEILTLNDVNTTIEVEENGTTAIENALIKARAYANIVNCPVMAMDDTLYLENVPEDKQPGMYVRRVNGRRLTDEEMIEHYTNLVREYGIDNKIVARWVYGMAIIANDEEFTYTWNHSDFYLTTQPTEITYPGYPLDSISMNPKLNKYFTELTEEDKQLLQENEDAVIDFISSHIG